MLLASLSDGSGAAKHAGDLAAAVIDSRCCEWGVREGEREALDGWMDETHSREAIESGASLRFIDN